MKEIPTRQIQNLYNEKYVKGIDTRQKCNETDMNRFIPSLKTQRQEIQNLCKEENVKGTALRQRYKEAKGNRFIPRPETQDMRYKI